MRATALLLVLSSLAGCSNLTELSSRGNLDEVVPRIASLFSACDLDSLVSRYASSVEFFSPSTPQPLRGREAIRSYFLGACNGATRPIMKVDSQHTKLLSSSSAVITGAYSFGRSDRPNAKPWPAFFVVTVVAEGNDWLITTQATFPIPE